MDKTVNSFDAIIVGAGPAGSTCAARLKDSGFHVKLFDKRVFPRVKPCAGWVTPQVIDALRIDIDDYRNENIIQPITGFRTGIIGGRLIETNYPQPVSYGICRIEFDNYLLQRSGVPCEFVAVKQVVRDDKQWRVNNSCTAPLLVGAGGHFCPVARYASSRSETGGSQKSQKEDQTNPTVPVVYAQEVEFEMSADQRSHGGVDAEKPELYFCADVLGYGWCFRKGNILNIGLGRIEKSDLSARVQQFCEFLRSQNKLVGEIPSHFLGHAYKLYAGTRPKLHDDGLLLIGDSAGLAYLRSGEGIRPAVESAIIAADVVADANGDYGERALATYRDRLVSRMGSPNSFDITGWLPAAWLQGIATRLMATRWFAKNVIIENWFLHNKQGVLDV